MRDLYRDLGYLPAGPHWWPIDSPPRGARVRVLWGRWATREGTLVAWHVNPGGMKQQSQLYPVVDLDPVGRAKARQVRVLAVEPVR